jgi:hypothetical protein
MTAVADVSIATTSNVLAYYERWVRDLAVTEDVRRDRLWRARRFLRAHPDLDVWMKRSTPTRLTDLHRVKAWPFLTWLFVAGNLQADLELLIAKPGGVDLPNVWAGANSDDVKRVTATATRMGWSANWTHQVSVLAMSTLCVWSNKTLDTLTDDDFDAITAELDRVAVGTSARMHMRTRLFALRHICFQLGVCALTPRQAGIAARSAPEHADCIACQRSSGSPHRRPSRFPARGRGISPREDTSVPRAWPRNSPREDSGLGTERHHSFAGGSIGEAQ